jgi:glycosyltransferase involved in cell wall biosynthesis
MSVAVYITSYDQKAFLVEAIESVLGQTYPPQEVIIVDDCSNDGSQDTIAEYAVRFPDVIKPIYHPRNLGVSRARIHALEVVTSDYVTYVDGDDRFLPTKIERELDALLQAPENKIAFSNSFYMTREGRRMGTWVSDEAPPQGDVFPDTFARRFPRHNLFRMELVEYEAWRQIGFHDPSLALYEDFDMRIRLSKHCRAVYVDEILSEIRTSESGLSKSSEEVHFSSLEYILQKNQHLLNDLSDAQRRKVLRMIRRWIAWHARGAALEVLRRGGDVRGRRAQALRYSIQYLAYRPTGVLDLRLLASLLLPRLAIGPEGKEGNGGRLIG